MVGLLPIGTGESKNDESFSRKVIYKSQDHNSLWALIPKLNTKEVNFRTAIMPLDILRFPRLELKTEGLEFPKLVCLELIDMRGNVSSRIFPRNETPKDALSMSYVFKGNDMATINRKSVIGFVFKVEEGRIAASNIKSIALMSL